MQPDAILPTCQSFCLLATSHESVVLLHLPCSYCGLLPLTATLTGLPLQLVLSEACRFPLATAHGGIASVPAPWYLHNCVRQTSLGHLMAGPHGQCLWPSDIQISTRNVVSGGLPRRGEEGKLARGGCSNLRHLFVHHTTSLLLGCCVSRGLHSVHLARRGAPDAAASMTKCAGPRTIAKRTPTRECFVNQRVRAAVGADTETVVFALTSVSCNHHITPHHDLWT